VKSKKPTRAQLTAKIALLERKLARFAQGDTLRREGEHWYELVEYFDAREIRRLPTAGSTYLLGVLDDVVVIEVPATATPPEIAVFQKLLRDRGMASPCLVIRAGVRFLKLASVDTETEAKLDAADSEVEDEDAEGEDDEVSALGAGPEPAGDGLGDCGSGDGGGHRGGSHRDEAAVEAGEEAAAGG